MRGNLRPAQYIQACNSFRLERTQTGPVVWPDLDGDIPTRTLQSRYIFGPSIGITSTRKSALQYGSSEKSLSYLESAHGRLTPER